MSVETLLRRMGEIDVTVTASAYTEEHRRFHGAEQDGPPTGEHYNLLWDAIMDEIVSDSGLSEKEVHDLLGQIQ